MSMLYLNDNSQTINITSIRLEIIIQDQATMLTKRCTCSRCISCYSQVTLQPECMLCIQYEYMHV